MDIKDWKIAIGRSEALQEEMHTTWNDSIDLVNCDYFDNLYGGDPDRVDVHFANWYWNNLIALTYYRDPYIFVKSKGSKFTAFADTMEQLINVLWKDLKLKNEFKRTISSAFIMAPGWVKIGYTAQIGQDIAKLESEEEKGLIKQLKEVITGVFKEEKASRPEDKGELNMYVKEESCFVSWVPSWNVLMPEGYSLVSRMPWLVEVEEIPLVDFINNPLYKNKKDLRPERTTSDKKYDGKRIDKVPFLKGASGSRDGNYSETDTIKLYHIWDRRGNERLTISNQSDEPHFRSEWPYDMTGFPLKPLIFDENLPKGDKASPYHTNMLKPIKPQIMELSNLRTQMAKWRKRASAIILAQKGLLTEDDIKQLEDSEALQIAYVSNINAVQMQQTPNLPQGVFQIDEIIDKDLQSATSMAQMMFQAPPGTRTATQANLAQSGLQLKAQSRVDVVEDFTVEVAESLGQTLWQFYDREKVAEIIGEEVSQEMWPDVPTDRNERRRVIRQYIQFRIDAGSTAPPKDETVDRKQLLDFASILNSIAPERLRKDEFAKQLVKKFKFTKEVDKLVITNDDQEAQAAMEENQLLASGIPQIVSPNTNHEIHIKVHSQMPPTPAGDHHIADHAKYMPQMAAETGGQGKKPGDIKKEGMTNQGDVYQSAQNLGVGTGPESQ